MTQEEINALEIGEVIIEPTENGWGISKVCGSKTFGTKWLVPFNMATGDYHLNFLSNMTAFKWRNADRMCNLLFRIFNDLVLFPDCEETKKDLKDCMQDIKELRKIIEELEKEKNSEENKNYPLTNKKFMV